MIDRLASDIRKLSYWKMIYVVTYFISLIILIRVLDLSWWIMAIVSAITIVVVFLSEWNQASPLNIHAPDVNNKDTHWQLLYSGRHQDELWEADLARSKSLAHCIQLNFNTVHPIISKKTVVIWKDQVNANTWRQLKIIARWS